MSVQIDMSGRRAIVTGGGSGIGEAIVKRLAEAGAAVAVADLFGDRAERVASEVLQTGGQAVAVQVDVTSVPSVEQMHAKVEEELGGVDVLINNAGAWTLKWFTQMDPAEYNRDIDVCLYGTMHCTRVCLPGMIERKYGRIVNTISDAGKVGEPTMTVYSAAKAGVAGFTKALAKEVGRYSITVNGFSPGTTRTPGNADIRADWDEEKVVKLYPLRRLGETIDHANAVLFLASDLSGWITGQILSVSGGYTTV
ncbi:MAG: SDR family oxidoreductase [Thermoleophilia bacterium]|nr:SDR family oxidoreductase [Thermoleophilia bacterium]